ncbi:MAG TPA: 50S ribosomal protein L24 [Ignavibacteria bacterium]|nr:50S ribosomal protein L24 [Bacteroidota bacterium]HRI84861.1 50S ribosomal protein L24 [Ignavibacteria bacterium]HRJ99775.1 50S ribosomal protein L24 [Ignavibacteria bacterium]
MSNKTKAKKTRLKKNDTVKVISGNSKGAVGKVLFLNNEKGSLIVEGVNIVHRHTKPSQKKPQGGIIKREAPINMSNVMLVCPKTNKPTRIGMQVINEEATGKKTKMRFSKQAQEIIIS